MLVHKLRTIVAKFKTKSITVKNQLKIRCNKFK